MSIFMSMSIIWKKNPTVVFVHKFSLLNFRDLQTLAFTEGAKGKLLKHLAFMRDRPRRIKELHQNLDVRRGFTQSTM